MDSFIQNLVHIPKIGIAGLIEIVLMAFVVYYLAKKTKGTRVWVILKGVLGLLCIYTAAYIFQFNVIVQILKSLLMFIGIAILLILQPEVRRLIENIGTNNWNQPIDKLIALIRNKSKKETTQLLSDKSVQEIVKGCCSMAKVKTGVLLVIEHNTVLSMYEETGIPVHADITAQLLINIFEKNTPLHDGAVLIRNNKIISATCYLPLSENMGIDKSLGTRHRAAIGLTEVADATVVVVSEETGGISVAYNGELKRGLTREELQEELKNIQSSKVVQSSSEKHSIFDNMTLKITSLIGTLILWLVVMSAVNPVVTTTIHNVKVEVKNESAISELGKTYEILSGDTVSVTVTARKSDVDQLTSDSIKVVADLSKLSIVNSTPLEVQIPSLPDATTKLSSNTMEISVEDIVDGEFPVEINQTEPPSTQYYISDIELSNDTLIISGAKSLVSKVGRVQVDIDASEITSNTTLALRPMIYDKNGELMDIKKFTLNTEEITASISLYNTKLVDLNISTTIVSDQINYILKSVDYDKKQIYVAGPQDKLDEIDNINISLYPDIAIEDISKSQFIRSIEIKDYLPEGLYVSSNDSKVTLTVDFKEFSIRTFTLGSADIKVLNLKSGLTGVVDNKQYKINLISLDTDVSALEIEDIEPYVDATSLSSGKHTLNLQLKNFPTGANLYGDTVINVTVS